MPGIPKSKRCQSCRRRKIKCDQNWPACTPCIRANIPCSGPSVGAKFVHNGCHAVFDDPIDFDRATPPTATAISSPGSQSLPRSKSPQYSMIRINSQDVEGGASYGYFRLSPGPKQYPTTVADRLSARLVAHLDRDSQRDVLLNVSYLKHIPNRLGESAALRDCIAVFVSAWSNFRRGRPMDQLIVPMLYGKALRSLQRVLNSRQVLKCETLAAITILERVEALFDRNRSQHRTMHAKGVYSLMEKRGPPSLDDPLDVHLALENQATLHVHCLVEGGDNFYQSQEWDDCLTKARRLYARYTDDSSPWSCAYSLDHFYERWPEFVHEMQDLLGDLDQESQTYKALDLQDKLLDAASAVSEVGDTIREKALSYGMMTESQAPESPVNAKYDFDTPELCELFISYVTIHTVFSRMLYDLSVLLGSPSSSRYAEYREMCRRSWMFVPYVRKMGLIIATMFTAPFYLTFEGAEGPEKDYIKDLLLEIDEYRQRLPKGPGNPDQFMLNTSKAMTGRMPFPGASSTSQEC